MARIGDNSKKHVDTSRSDTDNLSEDSKDEKSFSFRRLTTKQKIILGCTCITNLLSFLSLSILAPFFPVEAEKKCVSGTISGWIFGVFALVQFLISPLFGRLVPIVGSKFMYLSGVFACGGCTLLFGSLEFVDVSNGADLFIILCFTIRIFLAIACTAINNAGFVMLIRAFPDNVGAVFGIGEVFTGIGMVTGPAIGGFLFVAGGFILPFAVISGASFIMLPIIWIILPKQEDSYDEEDASASMLKLLVHPNSIINSIVVVIGASIWSVLDPTLEPHLRVYGFTPEIVGIMFLIMAALYSMTSPVWGWLLEKMPDNRVLLIPGFLLAAVGLLLLGPSPALGFDISYNELWLTIISLVILGTASSMVIIPTYDIYIDVIGDIGYPEDTRTYGMVSGLWVSMYALGDFAGPSIGGFLNEEIGFEWLATWFALACALTSVIVSVSWFVDAKCLTRSKKPVYTERTPLLVDRIPQKDLTDTCQKGSVEESTQIP